MNNHSMDKQETDFLLFEKTIDVKDVESCERDAKAEDNDRDRINDGNNIQLTKKRILQIIDYYNSRSKLSHDEVRRRVETICGKNFEQLPEMLRNVLIFINFPGDNGRSLTTKPDWFDMEKFKKGQTFARDNFAGIFMGQLYGLICLLCHEDGLKTLIITKKSHTPYLALNRYMSTAERIRNWFTEDPWCEGTKANKDIQTVRKMHDAVRRKLCELDHDEIDRITTIKNPHCPIFPVIEKDFSASLSPDTLGSLYYTQYLECPTRPKSINQMDMSLTLFGFMGLVVLFPNEFNIYPESDEDLENFCHVWRSIAYLLGVEDDANFCRGSLEDIRRRGHEYIDVVVKPAFINIKPQWEHMTRCIFEGLGYLYPIPKFEIVLLRIADLLNIEMPGLYASISYWEWTKHIVWKYLVRSVLRFTIMRKLANKVVNTILDRAITLDKTEHAKIQKKSMKTMLHVSVGT